MLENAKVIITKDFVILNLPKTGSSFVREVIISIYNKRGATSEEFMELMTPNTKIPTLKDQHGCYDLIPRKYQGRKIISVIRDPYLRLKSLYRYGWWKEHPYVDKMLIETHLPNFPNLSFDKFLEMEKLVNDKLKNDYEIPYSLEIGNQTIQFIRFFFRNHRKVLSSLTLDYFLSGEYKNDICDVSFLRNENLNLELFKFLSNNGFSNEEAEFALNHEKVNVTKSLLNENIDDRVLIEHINTTEWILFEILLYLGIDYRKHP